MKLSGNFLQRQVKHADQTVERVRKQTVNFIGSSLDRSIDNPSFKTVSESWVKTAVGIGYFAVRTPLNMLQSKIAKGLMKLTGKTK